MCSVLLARKPQTNVTAERTQHQDVCHTVLFGQKCQIVTWSATKRTKGTANNIIIDLNKWVITAIWKLIVMINRSMWPKRKIISLLCQRLLYEQFNYVHKITKYKLTSSWKHYSLVLHSNRQMFNVCSNRMVIQNFLNEL